MVAVTESQEKQLDVDSISEYIREQNAAVSPSKSHTKKDLFDSASEVISVARAIKTAVLPNQANDERQLEKIDAGLQHHKPDVLETLWPGIHQDFAHSVTVKRSPGYYLTLGLVGGAILAFTGVWGFNALSSLFVNYGKASNNFSQSKPVAVDVLSDNNLKSGVKVPLTTVYEVQDGDTLAGIALQNYKHISPRLLDEICKANNLTDANVLSTGQKLTLPEYRY